ncbi:hypothetical protein M0812_09031 [Anaeramoeba flamelloides]|uniref:Uncharacterized protein n=1 Tax=Anaeramoeba flamelloides TaxID=1746091 RepID=A0AAV7ZRC1_9EUKA|nr:hypothetical protein M0812_09031 [Anaeramoeba flamelloides]
MASHFPTEEELQIKFQKITGFRKRLKEISKIRTGEILGLDLSLLGKKRIKNGIPKGSYPKQVKIKRSCVEYLSHLTKKPKKSLERGITSFLMKNFGLENSRKYSREWFIFEPQSYERKLIKLKIRQKKEENKRNKKNELRQKIEKNPFLNANTKTETNRNTTINPNTTTKAKLNTNTQRKPNPNTNTKPNPITRSRRRNTNKNPNTSTNTNTNPKNNSNRNAKNKNTTLDLNKTSPIRKRLSSQIENNNQIEQFNTSLITITNQQTVKTKSQNEEIRSPLFNFFTQEQKSPLPPPSHQFMTTYKREPLFEETNHIENLKKKAKLQILPLIQPEFLFNFHKENDDFFGNNFEEETNLISLNDIWH